MLFYFKYANFVLESANALLGTSFAPIQGIQVLPLGISFYTFQTLSYSIDVYRRDVPAERNIIDFGAYVVMFPQLTDQPHRQIPGTYPTSCTSIRAATAPLRSRKA